MNVDFPGSPGVVHRKPNSGQHGAVSWFPRVPNVIPRGRRQNFKTSNGSLKKLPTSIRGRLWKLRFLGPSRPSAGSLVISKGSEVDFQVSPVGILRVPKNLKN